MNTRILAPLDSLIPFTNASFRAGAMFIYELNKRYRLETFGAIQVNSIGDTNSIGVYEFIANFNRLEVHAGFFGTPNTVSFKPNPITWRGQTQFYVETRFIGSRPGLKAEYEFSDDLHLVYGYVNHKGTWAHHIKLKYKGLYLGGFRENDNDYFLSVKLVLKQFEIIANYSNVGDEFAGALIYRTNTKFSFYGDFNFLNGKNSNSVSRLGARRHFLKKEWHLKGFLALEYDISPNIVTGQVFIHLN